jgi:tetratricopeptide (TPR) repeat protein
MDGRWSLRLVGGLLGGLIGCSSLQKQPTATPTAMTQTPPAGSVARMPTAPPLPPAPVAAAPTKLKPTTYVTMGTVAEQVAEDPDRPPPERDAARQQARQNYNKAIEIDPKHAPAYAALARSYALTSERDRSEAMFQKAQTLAPKDASIVFEHGQCLARAKDWDGAAKWLAQAAQMDPNNLQCQKLLGFTLARAGRYDDGLAALSRCMPEAEARYNLARMLQHNQQPVAAQQQLQMALRADPNFEPARAMLGEPSATPDTGIRTVGFVEPVSVAPTAPRLQPVTLGGGMP